MFMSPTLDAEDVARIVKAAKDHAAQKQNRPTIAVCDAAGHLLYLERPEVNGVNTVEMSAAKARTAALRGRPSGTLAERVKTKPGYLTAPNYISLEGGAPIFFGETCIGAIGVSGIAEEDEVVALYAARVLTEALSGGE